MRKFIFPLLLICFSLSSSIAQSAKEAFLADDMVWYGIDFSHVKLIGTFSQFGAVGEQDEDDIRRKYFPAWNSLIVEESSKYDLQGAFRKNKVEYKLAMMEEVNAASSNAALVSVSEADRYHLSEDKVKAIVSAYETAGEKGIGLVFIAESLDKPLEQGAYYVTFFDIATKEVFFTKRMIGKAGGFGLRNYWAKTYYDVIKECRSQYKKWLKSAK